MPIHLGMSIPLLHFSLCVDFPIKMCLVLLPLEPGAGGGKDGKQEGQPPRTPPWETLLLSVPKCDCPMSLQLYIGILQEDFFVHK